MRPIHFLLLCACIVLCVPGCPGSVPEEWPTLVMTDPPDSGVQPPDWYTPSETPQPWPLGPEPEYATREWRDWCSMRYARRAIVPWLGR